MGLERQWRHFQGTLRPWRVCIYGSFDCNTAADPVDVRGDLKNFFDITHDATGRFLLTWKNGDRPAVIVDADCKLEGDVTFHDEAAILSRVNAAADIEIKTFDVGGDTDITAAELIRVRVCLVVSVKTAEHDD